MQNAMTLHKILEDTTFGDWKVALFWVVDAKNDNHYYLRVQADGACNITGEPMSWQGRKWALSKHMTDGEVVQTAFLAIMTAMEHEIREQFKYKGQAVFDPHYNINKLVELRRQPDALKERD